MKTILIASALAIGVGSALAADVAPVASGPFKSHGLTMHVKSAMAFRGTSILDKSDTIIVAITSAEMDTDALAAYSDRRRAIDRRVKDDDNGVVYLEFRPNGAYRGLNYYFARGNGCGYCGGGVTSTVRLVNGRLAGSLKSSDDNMTFDVVLNVPITSDDHGAALPADGGAPGKVYLAYHEALIKRDAKALRTLLSDELRQTLAEATKDGKAAKYMNFLAKEHPGKSVRITKALSKGNQAVLLIAGESSTTRLTGEVVLLNQGGSWRIDDELTDVVMQ
jgi:predicted SnoaL-like aldol condensation-catalyzing enzyme